MSFSATGRTAIEAVRDALRADAGGLCAQHVADSLDRALGASSAAPAGRSSDGSQPTEKPSSAVPDAARRHDFGYGGTSGPKGAGPYKCRRCGTLTRSLAYEPALVECISVREAARRHTPLDGADAQALEGALTQAERELAAIREMLSTCAIGITEGRPLSVSIKRLVEAWQLASDDQDDITDAIEIREGEGVDKALERTIALARENALHEAETALRDVPAVDAADLVRSLRSSPPAVLYTEEEVGKKVREALNPIANLLWDFGVERDVGAKEIASGVDALGKQRDRDRSALAKAEQDRDEARKENGAFRESLAKSHEWAKSAPARESETWNAAIEAAEAAAFQWTANSNVHEAIRSLKRPVPLRHVPAMRPKSGMCGVATDAFGDRGADANCPECLRILNEQGPLAEVPTETIFSGTTTTASSARSGASDISQTQPDSALPGSRDESAWLIEAGSDQYWDGRADFRFGCVGHEKAVRFARLCDAQAVIDGLFASKRDALKASEHAWVSPTAATRTPEAPEHAKHDWIPVAPEHGGGYKCKRCRGYDTIDTRERPCIAATKTEAQNAHGEDVRPPGSGSEADLGEVRIEEVA